MGFLSNYFKLFVELFQITKLEDYVNNIEYYSNRKTILFLVLILFLLLYCSGTLFLIEGFTTDVASDNFAYVLFGLSLLVIIPIFLLILLSYSIFGIFFYNLFIKKQLNYISIFFHIIYSFILLSLFHLVFMILYLPVESIFQDLNIFIIPHLFYLFLTLLLVYFLYILVLIIKKQTQLSFKGALPYLLHIIVLLLVALAYIQDSMQLYSLLRGLF